MGIEPPMVSLLARLLTGYTTGGGRRHQTEGGGKGGTLLRWGGFITAIETAPPADTCGATGKKSGQKSGIRGSIPTRPYYFFAFCKEYNGESKMHLKAVFTVFTMKIAENRNFF